MRYLISILFVCICLTSVNAQTIEVLKDSTYTYTTGTIGNSSPVATYKWNVTGSTSSKAKVDAATGNSVTIVWDGTINSEATLEVSANSLEGCISNAVSSNLKIVNQYSPTTERAVPAITKVYNTSPRTTGNLTGGNDAGFDISIQLYNISLAPTDVISFRYQVDDASNMAVAQLEPGKTNGTVRFTGKNYTNTTGSDIKYNINLIATVWINGVQVKTKSPDIPKRSFVVYRSSKIKHIY